MDKVVIIVLIFIGVVSCAEDVKPEEESFLTTGGPQMSLEEATMLTKIHGVWHELNEKTTWDFGLDEVKRSNTTHPFSIAGDTLLIGSRSYVTEVFNDSIATLKGVNNSQTISLIR